MSKDPSTPFQTPPPQISHLLDAMDWDKLKSIFSKSWLWLILIMLLTCGAAFLYVRYTKPVYSAELILKLDIKNEANVLGLQNPITQDLKGISGEMEILKSRLLFAQVVKAIGLPVSYYHPGRSHLVDERYKNAPFRVTYTRISSAWYDKKFQVVLLGNDEYALSASGTTMTPRHPFGKPLSTKDFELTLHKTSFYNKKLADYYFIINSEAAWMDYFKNHVTIEPVNFNANTIKISLSDPNPAKARDLLGAIDTVYQAFTKAEKNKAVEQKIQFINNQIYRTNEKLTAYEDYFERFTIENKTTDLSKDLANTLAQLHALDSQRYKLRHALKNIERMSETLISNQNFSLPGLPTDIVKTFEAYQLLLNESALKSTAYNENTQVMRQMNQKIHDAKKALSSSIQAYKEHISEKLNGIAHQRTQLENSIKQLPAIGTSYNKNRRLYTLQEEFYLSLIQAKIELEITKAGTVAQVVTLSPASVGGAPVHPKKGMMYGVGVVAGMVLSLMFLAVRFLLHDKISSQQELEKILRAPLLGIVPSLNKEKMAHSKLVVTNNPKSALSESLRTIRTNMDFITAGGGKRVISVTSTVSGEGKTFIAVNLAAIFAYAGHKTVVVDLDMRKPKVHLAFGAKNTMKGMSTVLIGKEKIKDCIQKTTLEHLDFIHAGPTPPNPSELLLTPQLDACLTTLQRQYDVILLDTPPAGIVTDGVLVMKKVDLPLYVVRANYTKRASLKHIHYLMSNHQFKNLSVVFNHVKYSTSYGNGEYYGQD